MFRIGKTGKREWPPIEMGTLLSLIFVPILYLVIALSLPWLTAGAYIYRLRQRAFQDRMRARNRTIEWQDFVERVNEHRGTAIEESPALNRYGPLWWTEEDLSRESPYPIADWSTMRRNPSFDQFAAWCHHRYTSPEHGAALLVCRRDKPTKEALEFWSRVQSGDYRWVEVVPLNILSKRRKRNLQASI